MYPGMLTVRPSLRAKSIGKQLLAAAENYARQNNCRHVEIMVISIRHELIARYNKHGYQSTGVTEPFPPAGKFGIAKRPLEFVVLSKAV